jgi:hypothetical protein
MCTVWEYRHAISKARYNLTKETAPEIRRGAEMKVLTVFALFVTWLETNNKIFIASRKKERAEFYPP